jgi:catechol 2,3-dioxygenase-like lactoylglutathione lyase family enzyme
MKPLASLGWSLVAIAALADCMAQAETASMRPTLVALQVGDLEASIRWYTNYLAFQQKVRREFPDQQLKLAILNRADFELELVENPKTLKKAEVLSGKGTDVTGFAKITFTVSNVGKLFRQLSDKGATFAITLRDSNTKPDEQFFVVLDNERNWLQFVGKKS